MRIQASLPKVKLSPARRTGRRGRGRGVELGIIRRRLRLTKYVLVAVFQVRHRRGRPVCLVDRSYLGRFGASAASASQTWRKWGEPVWLLDKVCVVATFRRGDERPKGSSARRGDVSEAEVATRNFCHDHMQRRKALKLRKGNQAS